MSETSVGVSVKVAEDVSSSLPSAAPERPDPKFNGNGQSVAVPPQFVPVAQVSNDVPRFPDVRELLNGVQQRMQPFADQAVTTARNLLGNPEVLKLETQTRNLLAKTLGDAQSVFDKLKQSLTAGPDRVALEKVSERLNELSHCVANLDLPIEDCRGLAEQAKEVWDNAKSIVQNPAVQIALGVFDFDVLVNSAIALSEGNVLGALGYVVEWGVWQGVTALLVPVLGPGAPAVKEGLQAATKVIGKEVGEKVVKQIAGNLGEKVGEELLDDLFGDLLKGATDRLGGLALEGVEVGQEALARDFQQIFRDRVFKGLIGPDGKATEELGDLVRKHLNAEALTTFEHNGKKLGDDAIKALQESDELVEMMTKDIVDNVMGQVDDLLQQRGLTTESFREYLVGNKNALGLNDAQVETVTKAFTEGKDQARKELRDAVEAQVRNVLDEIRGKREEEERGTDDGAVAKDEAIKTLGIEHVDGLQTPELKNKIVPFAGKFKTTTAYAVQVGTNGTLEQVSENQVTGIKTT